MRHLVTVTLPLVLKNAIQWQCASCWTEFLVSAEDSRKALSKPRAREIKCPTCTWIENNAGKVVTDNVEQCSRCKVPGPMEWLSMIGEERLCPPCVMDAFKRGQ